MCVIVCVDGEDGRMDGILGRVTSREQNKHTFPCVYVTVPVTEASSAGFWDGPHPRGAYPQADQDRDGV